MSNENESKLVHVRLTSRQMDRLREMGRQAGDLTVSATIRCMIENATLEVMPRPVARIPIWANSRADEILVDANSGENR
jgi:hypothetical protein